MIRAFGVGYAPIGQYELLDHLTELGFSAAEIVEAGLATTSVRGRVHAQFRSRIMFPVRNADGRIRGFAGLGTHLGPSWSLWLSSPPSGPFRPSEAVFGLDHAASEIEASNTARLRRDCIEVLKAHQEGTTNAVSVLTKKVTPAQVRALAGVVTGGRDALELDLAPGMSMAPTRESQAPKPAREPAGPASGRDAEAEPSANKLKRLAIVVATAVAATNVWTGAPLLAVWVGSQVQDDRLVSMLGVVTVVAVLSISAFLLGWALAWLNTKYNELTGRPVTAGQTSLWTRSMRDESARDVFFRWGISAPEKVVALCVVAGVIAFEIWFFFFAGSSLPSY
jgi:hypothetical protein